MKYVDYSIKDFANDSFFIRWVKNPDEKSDWFWKSFVEKNPECSSTIEKARELVSLCDFPTHDLSEKEEGGEQYARQLADGIACRSGRA
jgi:hypothetical protein